MTSFIAIATVLGALLPPQEPADGRSIPASRLVRWIADRTGKRFIHSEALGLEGKKVVAPADVFESTKPYEVGLALLKTVGVAAIPKDKTGVIYLAPAPVAGKCEVPILNDPADLPEADEFCKLALRLKHVSPRNVQAVLINMASFPQNVLSAESAGIIFLADYASNLRELAKVARAMDDAPPASAAHVEVVILEGRNADRAAFPADITGIDLRKATGKNSFRLKGRTLARIDPQHAKPMFRFAGDPAYEVSLSGGVTSSEGFFVRSFQVKETAGDAKPARSLLSTEFPAPLGKWVLAGAVPGSADGSTLVFLVHVRAAK